AVRGPPDRLIGRRPRSGRVRGAGDTEWSPTAGGSAPDLRLVTNPHGRGSGSGDGPDPVDVRLGVGHGGVEADADRAGDLRVRAGRAVAVDPVDAVPGVRV